MNPNLIVYDDEDSPDFIHIEKYQSLIGSLNFISRCTGPDITYAVNMLSRFSIKPKLIRYNLAINILRYLIAINDKKIKFVYKKGLNLIGKVDSDFANNIKNRRSVTGYILYLNDNPFAWTSFQQTLIAQSSDEAEIIAANNAARELIYYRDLLNQMFDIKIKPTLYIDNFQA